MFRFVQGVLGRYPLVYTTDFTRLMVPSENNQFRFYFKDTKARQVILFQV